MQENVQNMWRYGFTGTSNWNSVLSYSDKIINAVIILYMFNAMLTYSQT